MWAGFPVEEKDETEVKKQEAASGREYEDKLEGELQKVYDGVFALVDRSRNPKASTEESMVKDGGRRRGSSGESGDEFKEGVRYRPERSGDGQAEDCRGAPGALHRRGCGYVDMVSQRQVLVIQKVLKIVEVPQVQYFGKIGVVSVLTKRGVTTIQIVQKIAEARQIKLFD